MPITVWYDHEGDLLEVTFEQKPGYVRATDDDRVMFRVDMDGREIGFSILGLSKLTGPPLEPRPTDTPTPSATPRPTPTPCVPGGGVACPT